MKRYIIRPNKDTNNPGPRILDLIVHDEDPSRDWEIEVKEGKWTKTIGLTDFLHQVNMAKHHFNETTEP